MGHITNPVGFRVGRLTNWLSLWSANKELYAQNWIIDLSFQRYFLYLFHKLDCLSYKKGFIFSHAEVFLISNFFYVTLYVYNSNIMLLHKGRFFYFWSRLSKIKSNFSRRVERSYFKVEFSGDNLNIKLCNKTRIQKLESVKDFNFIKSLTKKKISYAKQRLFLAISRYKYGFVRKLGINNMLLLTKALAKKNLLFCKQEKIKRKN